MRSWRIRLALGLVLAVCRKLRGRRERRRIGQHFDRYKWWFDRTRQRGDGRSLDDVARRDDDHRADAVRSWENVRRRGELPDERHVAGRCAVVELVSGQL